MTIEFQTLNENTEGWAPGYRLEAKPDGIAITVMDPDYPSPLTPEIYNPELDRCVTAAEGEVYLATLLKHVGNAYCRFVEIK